MPFKRYGGDIDSGKDSSDIAVSIFAVGVVVIFCVIALLTAYAPFVVFGFCLGIIIFGFSMLSGGGATKGIKRKRYNAHVNAALSSYEKRDLEAASKYLNKAKIHFPLEGDALSIYKELNKQSDNT